MKKRLTFIINPISGTKDKKSINDLIDNLINRDRYEVNILYTQYAGHGAEIATKERDAGTDVVVAVGGDGTVNEIGRALVGSDTAMGIIPCGSGNGLARHLRIPMDVKGAVEVLNLGHEEVIDYGLIDNHPFFCTCGVGFDATVTAEFTRSGSRGFLTYIQTTLQQYLKYRPEEYGLTMDDGALQKTYRAFVVTIGNASQYGNNAYIAPRATMKDGLLDVVVMAPFSFLDVPMLAYRLFHKSIDRSPHTFNHKCTHLVISREKSGDAHFDGEPLRTGKNIDIRIVKGGLKVVVMAEAKEI